MASDSAHWLQPSCWLLAECPDSRDTPSASLYFLVPQRTLTEFIEPRYAALPMGAIARVVPLLPVGHEVEHCRGIEDTPGQDTPQQHLHLGEGQGWGFFF